MMSWNNEEASDHRGLAQHLAERFGAGTLAILHYGSRAQGRHTGPDSAYDFFIIVAAYRPAFQCFAATSTAWNRADLATALAHFLPPTAVSIRHALAGDDVEAKCIVMSERHFLRECSSRARDHFVRGRLCQPPRWAWSRDPAAHAVIAAGLDAIRLGSIDWLAPTLPRRFDVAEYCKAMLRISLAHELRTEGPGHADVLFAAQQQLLLESYGPVLAQLTNDGILVSADGKFALMRQPSGIAVLQQRWYFRWSWLRSTARLLKHPLLYAGWLEYLAQKVHRSTGETVTLSAYERRWPAVFLWPRIIEYLRCRPLRDR